MTKIGIIGIGRVGAHILYTLALRGICDEIVLIDINEAKIASEAQDMFDASLYLPHKTLVKVGDYSDLKDCDIVISALGNPSLLKETHNRNAELNFTIPIIRECVKKINKSGFKGVFINATNPNDVTTREFAKGLNLEEERVFGTGTGLDTARLIAQLENATGVNSKSICAYMIGEHGNSQICPWSNVRFGGLSKEEAGYHFDTDELQKKAIQGGWVVFNGKGCTEYAITCCVVEDVYAVLHDEKKIIPCSVPLNGKYGQENVYAGVPCVVGKNGIEKIIELNLTDSELNAFKSCCESIREKMKIADSI